MPIVDDAWAALVARVPALAPGRVGAGSRGTAHTPTATPLPDGDEVACIPPVVGGAADDAHDDAAPPGTRSSNFAIHRSAPKSSPS